MCHQTPLVEVTRHGAEIDQPSVLYTKVGIEEAAAIVKRHFALRGVWRRLRAAARSGLDRLVAEETPKPLVQRAMRDGAICEFLGRQQHLATEYCGHLNPLDADEYERHDGFAALRTAITMTPEALVDAVTRSGLRGRGGAGFPTGRKWAITRAAKGSAKFVICNGDEGDPGAFMDRMILESYPYRVLEGMAIAARAVGAEEGYLYVRAEYPLAVQRIRAAIKVCEERGILGDNVLGSGKPLRLKLYEGAGAFVCGEETALIQSIEGNRGMPQLRPPYPAEEGLWGKPTNINNVETYALVPWIMRHGWEAFARIGTEKSKGTKVFALTGKVRRGGLIEVPMGITIREIVAEIGGGVADEEHGRRFKAVQIGGPSGGCIPAELADTRVDYESLARVGAIMGSGGLVVMDDRDCMVDIARYFLRFTQAESCGKCTLCRVGTKRMLEILERLCEGKARGPDLKQLEELAQSVKIGSVCGLGQTAPNPVLSTLKYFREEYEAHLKGHCPAGKCKALIKYEVGDGCIGCTKCAQECPAGAIPFTPYQVHTIDAALCTRCDVCRQICPTNAIAVR